MLTSPVHEVARDVEESDRVVVRGSTGRRSKASRRRRRTPTGLEQPAPAPTPDLYVARTVPRSTEVRGVGVHSLVTQLGKANTVWLSRAKTGLGNGVGWCSPRLAPRP